MVMYEHLLYHVIHGEFLDIHSFLHNLRINFKSFVKNLKMIDSSSADTETAEAVRGMLHTPTPSPSPKSPASY